MRVPSPHNAPPSRAHPARTPTSPPPSPRPVAAACAAYIGGGYTYNYKVKELRGREAVPQLEYWEQVPGLVKDGCAFSWGQTKAFVQYLKDKKSGGGPQLNQALSSAEDGGPSTDYQNVATS